MRKTADTLICFFMSPHVTPTVTLCRSGVPDSGPARSRLFISHDQNAFYMADQYYIRGIRREREATHHYIGRLFFSHPPEPHMGTFPANIAPVTLQAATLVCTDSYCSLSMCTCVLCVHVQACTAIHLNGTSS